MLNSNDLNSLKTLNQSAMGDLCTIERNTPASDGIGGQTPSWATVSSNVQCRVRRSMRDPRTKVIAEKLGITAVYEVVFPAGTSAKEDDRLTITPFQAPSPVRVMTVRAALQNTYETGLVCVCTEVL